MTKEQALNLFKESIDLIDLQGNFPDVEFVITELDDGQQEIIVRLQGIDPDFHPSADILAIDAMTFDDMPDGMIKNTITLRQYKDRLKRDRMDKFHSALLKRNKSLITPAGVSDSDFAKVIQYSIPFEGVEI